MSRQALCVGVLSEVASILERYGHLRCTPTVEINEDGEIVLAVRVKPEMAGDTMGAALDAMDFHQELIFLEDICTLRAFAAQYDISVERLEAVIQGAVMRMEDQQRQRREAAEGGDA